MTEAISMQLGGFLSIYLLLLVIAGIFTYCKIPQTKFLLLGTLQMTVQLIIAGYVLLYIFQNPSPIFVLTYLSLMVGFAVTRTLRKIHGLTVNSSGLLPYPSSAPVSV